MERKIKKVLPEKRLSRKGLQFIVIVSIILLVVILLVAFGAIINPANSALNSVNFWNKTLELSVEQHTKELNDYYNMYQKNDGGFDNYESSILLAKAIEFTWKDCNGVCKEYQEPFTAFFATHPINFNQPTVCLNYPRGEDWPDISRISSYCDDFKQQYVDEWTVTIYGLLANTNMCTSYKFNNNQWGNSNCGAADMKSRTPDISCSALCSHGDYVDWPDTAGRMEKDKPAYGNIIIGYMPEEGIIFKNPAKITVEIS